MQLRDLHIRKEIYLLWFDKNGEVVSEKFTNKTDKLNMEVMEVYEDDDYVEVWLK